MQTTIQWLPSVKIHTSSSSTSCSIDNSRGLHYIETCSLNPPHPTSPQPHTLRSKQQAMNSRDHSSSHLPTPKQHVSGTLTRNLASKTLVGHKPPPKAFLLFKTIEFTTFPRHKNKALANSL